MNTFYILNQLLINGASPTEAHHAILCLKEFGLTTALRNERKLRPESQKNRSKEKEFRDIYSDRFETTIEDKLEEARIPCKAYKIAANNNETPQLL